MFKQSLIYMTSIKKIAATIIPEGGTILITGASGLIGTCLVDVFYSANMYYGKHFTIYALSRDSDKLKILFDKKKDVCCVAQNVAEPITIANIDYIVHTASIADPVSYARFPVETILTNVLGAKNVLDYCKANNTRALLTSTFEVNGKLEQDNYKENEYGTVDLNLIRSCYPESKRTAEMLFKSYWDEYGVDCLIARLPSVYGPTMHKNDSKAQSQFLRNAIAGKDIVLKSKGTQRRSYCYVMDIISGIIFLLFKGKTGDIYNIANEFSVTSIYELAQTIAYYSNLKVVFESPSEIERKGFSKPQNCILNTKKINDLGWKGMYDLNSGIKETLDIMQEWFKGKHDILKEN
jgi:nucleoside-diphosphate-sugar epimerase